MPIKEITISNPSPYEAVDVITSSELKEPHRRYGNWMKKLAGIVKEYYKTKGNWQALWTIATRVFGLRYRGHSLEVLKSLAEALALEMNVDPGIATEMAERIDKELSNIIGEKRARGIAPESELF